MSSNLVGPFVLRIAHGVLQNSSDVFNILDPDSGGASTFRIPTNTSGSQLDAIEYWYAYSKLEAATYTALTTYTTQQLKDYVDQLAILRGRTPVGSITAFPNNLAISVGNPWTFMASTGQKVIVQAGGV